MSLYCKQETLVVVEQQASLSEMFEQGVNLSVLKLNVMLLALVRYAREFREENVPWLEDVRHVRRRNGAMSGVEG